MIYRVEYTNKAKKDLRRLPQAIAENIILSINEIKQDPYSHVKKIKGTNRYPLYTHRVGEYRAILDIQDDRMLILILETGHRGKIYRKY